MRDKLRAVVVRRPFASSSRTLLQYSLGLTLSALPDCYDYDCDERHTSGEMTLENLAKAMSDLNGGMNVTDEEISAMMEDATTHGYVRPQFLLRALTQVFTAQHSKRQPPVYFAPEPPFVIPWAVCAEFTVWHCVCCSDANDSIDKDILYGLLIRWYLSYPVDHDRTASVGGCCGGRGKKQTQVKQEN